MKERCEEWVQYLPLEHGTLRREVEGLALAAYQTLQIRDAGRLDFRLDRQGHPAFMEVNPLPGMHPTHSDLPMIATQEGMSFGELVKAILDSAFARLPELTRQGTLTAGAGRTRSAKDRVA
jgi:D-alanine-D-alanine ligase